MTQIGLVVVSVGLDDDPRIAAENMRDALVAVDPPSVPRMIGGGTAGGVRLVVEPHASTVLRWLDASEGSSPAPGLGIHGAVLRDLTLERNRQVAKGYTEEHDDAHTVEEFVGHALDRLNVTSTIGGTVYVDPVPDRTTLVEVAAMLVAAVESIDRRARAGT